MNHKQAVDYILTHPTLICKRKPRICASNVLFYKRNGHDLEGEVDNIIFDGTLYLIEYKANQGDEHKARRQLLKQEDFLRRIGYDREIQKVFIYGDIKELK